MKITFEISAIMDIIKEDASRLGARSYSEDGVSLYDGIRITSRDENVLSRMLEERDARLRELLIFCLNPAGVADKTLDYDFLDTEVNPSISSPLKVLLRKYLTDGVLCDWYIRQGIASSIIPDSIDEMETKIVCLIRQGFVKKPLQPYGPRD